MKKVFFAFVFLSSLSLSAQEKKQLTVEFSGLDPVTKGSLSIGVFNEKQSIQKNGKVFGKVDPVISRNVPVTAKKMKVNIPVLRGVYAIAVFVDKNKNKKMDRNAFGIPEEPYAFSNNAKATFGPPKFKKASFKVVNDTVIRIDL